MFVVHDLFHLLKKSLYRIIVRPIKYIEGGPHAELYSVVKKTNLARLVGRAPWSDADVDHDVLVLALAP